MTPLTTERQFTPMSVLFVNVELRIVPHWTLPWTNPPSSEYFQYRVCDPDVRSPQPSALQSRMYGWLQSVRTQTEPMTPVTLIFAHEASSHCQRFQMSALCAFG